MAKLIWRWAPGSVKVHMLRWLCLKYGLYVDDVVLGEGALSDGQWEFHNQYGSMSLKSGWDEAEKFIVACSMGSMWTKL